jgi:hypothetical protein
VNASKRRLRKWTAKLFKSTWYLVEPTPIRVWQRLPAGLRFRFLMARRCRSPSYLLGNQAVVEIKGLQFLFEQRVGYRPNITDPKTFNEKIQWRKLFDRRQLFIELADKERVRHYVAQRAGGKYLIPLLAVSGSARKLDVDCIDPPYVIKVNNASGKVYFVRTAEDANPERMKRIKRTLNIHLYDSYGLHKGEWVYSLIPPKIIVERMLLDPNGGVPADYKLHCFGGRAEYIEVHTGRFTRHARSIFDRQWQRLNVTRIDHPNAPSGMPRSYAPTADVPRPKQFEEMIQVAEALAEELDYVRVDLYVVGDRIYFGELTLCPASGFKAFDPAESDRQWGDLWKLPAPDMFIR